MRNVFGLSRYDNHARGTYNHETGVLNILVDNIWGDALDFDKFVEYLHVIYLTELSCVIYHGDTEIDRTFNLDNLYCVRYNKRANQCVFLKMAKKIYNSDCYLKF